MKVEFPKWVYKKNEAKIVNDKAEYAKAKRAGWKETPAKTEK